MNGASPNSNWPNQNWPNLNWKEIELLGAEIAPELEGLFVERVIVPSRPRFPQGYLKGEWVIRLRGRRADHALLVSVRPREPYFALYEGKGPQAAPEATHSPFDLALSKHLRDARLSRAWVIPRERVLVLDFEQMQRLVLFLVPSNPEALLVRRVDASASVWPVTARSRTIRENSEGARDFSVPQGLRAPENPPVRKELVQSKSLLEVLELRLEQEAFLLRLRAATKILSEKRKTAGARIHQSEVALQEARNEPDWQRFGDLLKGAIGTIAEEPCSSREVTDYETQSKMVVPCDPKLALREQIAKFYLNARRKQRRFSEAESRKRNFSEALSKFERMGHELEALDPLHPEWKKLEQLERALGSGIEQERKNPELAKRRGGGWMGKSFESRDRLPIWVGRSRDENLELTFKHARGNDLWMHVRGRPGAHVVIPMQPGKSAPLETLLDAANLAIYYSGGENWGKTEVDYTSKKYVKRIKDSTEASYINNKTLLVTPDSARLKRLLGGEEK